MEGFLKSKLILSLLALVLMAGVIAIPLSGSITRSHAAAAAPTIDPIVGDWNVTYGAPAVVTMTLSGGVYTVTAKTPVRVTGSSCDLPIGTILATFSSIGGNAYSGQHGLWYTSNCSFGFWDSMSLTLSSDGNTLTGVLAGGYGTVTFTKVAGTGQPPGPPTVTHVTAGVNGGADVAWQPPANSGSSPVTGYTVTATPYADSDHFAPVASTVTVSVPSSATSASFTNLIANCHQEYVFTVSAQNAGGTGPASAPSSPTKTSGYVSGPPPVVEILIDGESSHIDSSSPFPAFNPLSVPSYCPEAGQNPPIATNFSQFSLLNDPTVMSWSVGYAPQYVTPANTLSPSHHYLTDAAAAIGGVILPYSYAGATMQKNGSFNFTPYSADTSATQPLNADVNMLSREVSSINAAWPGTHIILVGHSWGGVIAEQYWKQTNVAAVGVVRVFALDAPINGTYRSAQCVDLHIPSVCSALVSANGGNIGHSLIEEMGDRWDNLQTLDSQIISRDQDKSFIDIGTHGDPAYDNLATNGKFDSFIPQLVMSSCDNSNISNQCYSSPPFQPSVATNCTDDNGSPWQSQGHFTVRECPDTANLIDQAVASL